MLSIILRNWLKDSKCLPESYATYTYKIVLVSKKAKWASSCLSSAVQANRTCLPRYVADKSESQRTDAYSLFELLTHIFLKGNPSRAVLGHNVINSRFVIYNQSSSSWHLCSFLPQFFLFNPSIICYLNLCEHLACPLGGIWLPSL